MFITTILVSSSLIAAGDFQIEDVLPSEAVFSCSVENLNHVYESMITKTQREKMYTLMSVAFAGGEGGEMCSAIESQCKELMAQSDAIGYMFRGDDDELMVSFQAGVALEAGSRCEHLKGKMFPFDWKKIYIKEKD